MSILTVLMLIIFAATAASTFYFWQKGQNIIFRYNTWKDAFFKPFSIRSRVPEPEWRLFKKYSRYQAYCFFGGILLMVLLFVLQGMFHLSMNSAPKQP